MLYDLLFAFLLNNTPACIYEDGSEMLEPAVITTASKTACSWKDDNENNILPEQSVEFVVLLTPDDQLVYLYADHVEIA